MTSILAVEDLTSAADSGQFTTTEVFARHGDGPLEWTGNLPIRVARSFADAGLDVRSVLGEPAAVLR